MLAIGAGLAPDGGRRGASQCAAVQRHALAVALHLQLLQVGRVAAHGCVVRRHAAAGKAVEVAVPHIQQSQAHRQVLRQRCGAKVLVHGMATGQELTEALLANGDGHRQTNGRPQRIAPTHPVPKTKGGGDAQCARGFEVGGQGHEVPRHILTTPGSKPGQRRARVHHGLGRGERLGRNDEQGVLGLEPLKHMVQFMAIDVRDEMETLGRNAELFQRPYRHVGAQVGSADTDVHHIGDGGIAAHLFGKGQHRVQRAVHIGQALSCFGHIAGQSHIRRPAQQGVQHGTVLCGVDGLARKHGVAVRLKTRGAGQIQQQRFRFAIPQILGQISEHMGGRLAEMHKAVCILLKRPPHVQVTAPVCIVRLQQGPGGSLVATEGHEHLDGQGSQSVGIVT